MVTLMGIFLSCFPLMKAMKHEPVSALAFVTVFCFQHYSLTMIAQQFQRGSSFGNLLNMSVLKEHLDTNFNEVAVHKKALPRLCIQVLRKHGMVLLWLSMLPWYDCWPLMKYLLSGYHITETELRLALQRRKMTMSKPIELAQFIRVSDSASTAPAVHMLPPAS